MYPDFNNKMFNFLNELMDSEFKVKVLTTKEKIQLLDCGDFDFANIRICEDMFGEDVVVDGQDI